MKFQMVAKISFGKEVESLASDVGGILEASKDLLLRGAPPGKEDEATRLLGWKIGGNSLYLKMESGRYVRAHDGLLRLAKRLSEEMGKKHRIGVREILVEKYDIEIPVAGISEAARKEIEKLPYRITTEENCIKISLENVGEKEIRGRVVDRLIGVLEAALAKKEAPPQELKIARASGPKEHKFSQDPFEAAMQKGWIVDFPGRGQWIYLEPYARVLRAIEEIIIEKIAIPLGFREVMFPKLIPLEVMQKMPGYLDGVPEGMYYVCPPPREPEAFSSFKHELTLKKEISTDELRKVLKDPAYVLAPAQCEPFYQQFSGKVIRLEDLPVKQFDRSGWTYRWEGGGVEGLLRTQEFRRIEFVMIGAPGDVVKIRDDVLEKSIEVMEELDLEWRVTVATPFYMREAGGEVGEGEKVATYDLEVLLPYKNGWLEIGSYNVHREKFVKSFKIKEAKGREVWTGCCGFGTSRWVVGFLAQHGLDPSSWPYLVRKMVEPLPPPTRVSE
ncbi:MAG: serine--tRNA ligase [Candidatus Hadarchaeales archaeon]